MNNIETPSQHPLSSRLSEPRIPQLCDQSTGLADDVQAPAQPQEQAQELGQEQRQEQSTATPPPILRLPEDILLYIASPRFLSLNDIVQWRATASVFHQSIPLPHATMILQAAHLFQVRPRRGLRQPEHSPPASPTSPSSHHPRHPYGTPHSTSRPKDIHSLFKDRQLQDIIARLTRLLTHPEFQPRLMRSSYSFRIQFGASYDLNTFRHSREQSYLQQQQQQPQQQQQQQYYSVEQVIRTKRTRRDLQDYPIFVTGNPPDLVRLAIEFGHVPFIDHLLHRGFRPRDLPEYFSSLPFLSVDDLSSPSVDVQNATDNVEGPKRRDTADSREGPKYRSKQTPLLKRSLELTQIWECMRIANQELMDACSRADLEGVLKVLDATLVHPRSTLDYPTTSQSAPISASNSSDEDERPKRLDKGKQKHISYEGLRRQDSVGAGSVNQAQDYEQWDVDGGVGSSSSTRQRSTFHSRDQSTTVGHVTLSEQEVYASPMLMASTDPSSATPTVVHRSTFFRMRRRVDSDVSQLQSPLSTLPSPSVFDPEEPSESQTHMPWVDGRALTSALLAVCFRRDGYESEEAAALEENRAVPIVNEILKYDCMLTAQSLGQAVQAVAYSRPLGSLKRAYDQRQQRHQRQRQDQASTTSSRPESVSRSGSSTATPHTVAEIGVMDLLMERIGPREWLKLIKSYLQRREFEDLTVLLELCPFKGPQLETKDKDQDQEPQYYGRIGPRDTMNRQDYYRQQARELICREAGICGVGTRLGHFIGRGIGQSSYNVAATLHTSSRLLFTGSGTRFNNTFMLPRGGFRGIGGNTSGHSSSIANSSGQSGESAESSFNATEGEEGEGEEDEYPGSVHGGESTSDYPEPPRPVHRGQRHHSIHAEDGSEADGDESSRDEDFDQDSFDHHDTSLAFGSVGSSTTSSSRPGPGIVGIAIQVQAPDHILRTLLKMGFRFFSICDLSISDARHPLALQFRQQERMNRLMIDFCMAPNVEAPPPSRRRSSSSRTGYDGAQTRRRRSRKDRRRYDTAEQEYYAQAVERFLYPAATNPARGSGPIPALPSRVRSNNAGRGSMAARPSPTSVGSTSAIGDPATNLAFAQPSPSLLTPSDRLQFILPPVPLGESFESITTASEFPGQDTRLSSPAQVTFNQPRYLNRGLALSMPLPIRASMVEARRRSGASMLASLDASFYDGDQGSAYQWGSSPVSAYQRIIDKTVTRRVREFLASDYVDLTTVGICVYQACYHKKELLLRILLEHRLLIAQDTLAGAVQVAASVGWKRGLEILLIQHGDMEAEINPVVTTTSEHIHHGTSMKWDHATATPMHPGKPTRFNSGGHPGGSGSWRRGGSDYSHQMQRSSSNVTTFGNNSSEGSGNAGHNNVGVGIGAGVGVGVGVGDGLGTERPPQRSSVATSSGSLYDSQSAQFPVPQHASSTSALGPPLVGPFVPAARSSSLRMRLSMFLPNLPGTNTNNSKGFRRKQKSKEMQQLQQLQLQQQQHSSSPRPRTSRGHPAPVLIPRGNQRKTPPPVLMLSTSMLWPVPNVMLQRKNRNAVLALMAATTRNDPGLVRWLVESLADIKVAHIMQALMIACDQGFVKVVRELVGGSASDRAAMKDAGGNTPRLLLRRWLGFQYRKIMEHTIVEGQGPISESTSSEAAAAAGAKNGLVGSGSSSKRRIDSFPFIFLMEMSPIFRHYFQILNTLSSCQFMTQTRSDSPFYNADQTDSDSSSDSIPHSPRSPSSPLQPPARLRRCQRWQQQQQQQYLHHHQASRPRPPARQGSRTTQPRTPQETKQVLIQILLQPILETFGSISFRKALDRIPNDCWWPLDYDVRVIADQEARKTMVAIMHQAKEERLRREEQQQQRQQNLTGHGSIQQDGLDAQRTAEEGGRGTKVKWHKRVGQRIRKWTKLKKVTTTKTEAPSSSPPGPEETERVEATGAKNTKSFFRRLSLARGSTNA
ncbi:hypothetical protein BGX34_007861 [Mortierella sp. NVP85]|nr:hypothetical protein BGX34_007861 [Mortierella sp. NVP85]